MVILSSFPRLDGVRCLIDGIVHIDAIVTSLPEIFFRPGWSTSCFNINANTTIEWPQLVTTFRLMSSIDNDRYAISLTDDLFWDHFTTNLYRRFLLCLGCYGSTLLFRWRHLQTDGFTSFLALSGCCSIARYTRNELRYMAIKMIIS